MKGLPALLHRWGPVAAAVAIPCCLATLMLLARYAITRTIPQPSTIAVAIEQLPKVSDPQPLLDIIVDAWSEYDRHHPHMRPRVREALIAATKRAIVVQDARALTAVAEAMVACGLWSDMPIQLRQAINDGRLTPRPHVFGVLILLICLLLPIIALVVVWHRWQAGPPPIDPKAETLENVEPIDVDTSDITIVSADTRPGTHTTTMESEV